MRSWLTAIATAVPVGAWAHDAGPVGHAHPHGLEVALAAFALAAAASLAPAVWRAVRARRERRT